MRTVIYGGSFDPVHNGHISAVTLLRKHYDRVIVMPAYVSPFKQTAQASDADRLAMLKLAFGSMRGAEISAYELDRGGVSYTYETLRAFPSAAFALGGDSMNTLARWTRAEELRGVELALIDRAGTDCTRAVEDWLQKGGRIVRVGRAEEASSTLARLEISLGLPAPVPDSVRAYIDARALYREWRAITDLYPRFGMKPSRVAHSYGVAVTACRLAERNGVDPEPVIRAALLHDIAKYLTADEARAMGVNVSKEAEFGIPAVRHADLGADLVRDLLGESKEVSDIVRYHSTGRAGMTVSEAVVCLADYIEPGRSFEGVEEIRALAERDLTAAMTAMFGGTIRYLTQNGKEIDARTFEAYEYYKTLQGDENGR